MPNIKISALPPAALPLDDPNTLFEVTVLEAGLEVSRKITLSEIAGATGLDASFLTLSANAQLPNERVLTEGTNVTFVDSGPNGTLTINVASFVVSFPLLAPDGSAVAPSYSFTNDPGAGMFLTALGELSFAADGVEIARALNLPFNQFAITPSGSSAVPELAGLTDLDTGFRWPADNTTVWIGGGSRAWNFSTTKFFSQFSNGPGLFNRVAQNDVPTLVPDHMDDNTGIGGNGSDELSGIAGGVEAWQAKEVGGAVQLIIDPGNTATEAAPALAFGDGDSGFRQPLDDNLQVVMVGVSRFFWDGDSFNATTGTGPAMLNVAAGATVPGFVPRRSDPNTGLGSAGSDELTEIAGGIEAVRWRADSGNIQQINQNQVGITASVTQTQAGGFALNSSYNEIGTVANSGDALTAFNAFAGARLIVINNGANDLQLFPAPSDDIGAGVDASITIGVGNIGIFLARDGTNWDTLYNDSPSPGAATFPILATDGSAAAPSYSFAADTDIGMFRNGADILSFSARATEMLQVVGALGANQVIVAPGAIQNNLSAPDLAFGDGDTGIMQTVDNTLAIVTGATQAVRYEEASAGIIQSNSSDVGLTASVTQTQAGGLALLSSYNEISTVGTTGDALTAFDVFQGHRLIVVNNGANDLQLFPAVGDDIGAGVDTAVTIAAGELGVFLGRDSINWDTLYNAAPSPGGPGGVLPAGTIADSSLKWNGAANWIEETQVAFPGGATGLKVFDLTLGDFITMGHNGTTAGFSVNAATTEVIFGQGGGPSTGWRFNERVRFPDASAALPGIAFITGGTDGFYRAAGPAVGTVVGGVEHFRVSNANTFVFSDDFRLQPNIGADLVRMIVNGPSNLNDFEIELTSLIDIHVTGSTGERFVLEEFNLAMVEKAAAPADVATVGQFWVRNDVPNIPMYTDDAGTDFKLGVANDAVQARRTTSFTITTAFTDVDLDTTDIETDPAIIEHSGTTDRIEATVAGTYEITYGADIDPGAAGNDNIQAFGRVRLNDAGVDLPGSLASQSAFEDASTIGNQVFGRLQCSFIVALAASDFITLQMMKVEIGGTGIFTAEEVTVTAKRLL